MPKRISKSRKSTIRVDQLQYFIGRIQEQHAEVVSQLQRRVDRADRKADDLHHKYWQLVNEIEMICPNSALTPALAQLFDGVPQDVRLRVSQPLSRAMYRNGPIDDIHEIVMRTVEIQMMPFDLYGRGMLTVHLKAHSRYSSKEVAYCFSGDQIPKTGVPAIAEMIAAKLVGEFNKAPTP